MAFDEIRFPTNISYRSSGGPEFKTNVVELGSGHEVRDQKWEIARHRYDVAKGVRTRTDLDRLLDFFYARAGKARGFRYKDWGDFQATTENIGTGDGSETEFQLRKQYSSGAITYNREIQKVVIGSLTVYVDGIEQTEGVGDDYTCDYSTGLVTFNAGSEPGNTLPVTATFQFDVPVRFDVDYLPITLEGLGAGEASGATVIEIKPTSTTSTSTTTTVSTSTSTTSTTTTT